MEWSESRHPAIKEATLETRDEVLAVSVRLIMGHGGHVPGRKKRNAARLGEGGGLYVKRCRSRLPGLGRVGKESGEL